MKVAILTRDYPPAIGGIATHVEGLVKALRRLAVEAEVYVGSNDVKTLLLPFDMPLKEYDVVHVQSLPYGAFVVGTPLVVTVHSPVLEEFEHYRNSLKVASIPAIALERATLSRARAVLAVSAKSRLDLVGKYGIGPEEVEVIGNGVDFEKFSGRRESMSPAALKRVLVVSRLEPRKNVKEAIEAVAELPRGSCLLDIVGGGSERGTLTALVKSAGAEDVVHFLGHVREESLPELYAGSAIFLTTSRSEGFGLSLLEAMACVVKGTLVSTSVGQVPIQKIQRGTLVLTHAGRFRPVLRTFKGIRGGVMYVIETAHGRLCVTPTHKFLTKSGWSSADSLYARYKFDQGRSGVHCWLSGWREPYDDMHSEAEQERQAPWNWTWNPANNSSFPERQTPTSSVLVEGETRRVRHVRSTPARLKMDDWRQTCRWSHTGDLTAYVDLQEGCRNGPLGGMQQEALIRSEHAGRLDLVYRQGYAGAYDKFGVQPGTPSKDSRQPRWVKIRSICPIQFGGEIYDLSVADDNSYIANGIAVHNSGCACVASDLPTHRALVEHGVSGLIYRSRQELVAYLRDLLASPVKVRELGTSAQRVARAHTWEKVAERVSGAYARVARGSKA